MRTDADAGESSLFLFALVPKAHRKRQPANLSQCVERLKFIALLPWNWTELFGWRGALLL